MRKLQSHHTIILCVQNSRQPNKQKTVQKKDMRLSKWNQTEKMHKRCLTYFGTNSREIKSTKVLTIRT